MKSGLGVRVRVGVKAGVGDRVGNAVLVIVGVVLGAAVIAGSWLEGTRSNFFVDEFPWGSTRYTTAATTITSVPTAYQRYFVKKASRLEKNF